MLPDIYQLGTVSSKLKLVEGQSGPLIEWADNKLLLRGKPCTILEALSVANCLQSFYSEIVILAKAEMRKQEAADGRGKG